MNEKRLYNVEPIKSSFVFYDDNDVGWLSYDLLLSA